MANKIILVTGATGHHGSTGHVVAEALVKHGLPVRVLARKRNDITRHLEDSGAQVVIGDLHDRRTLLPALEGVRSAYFTYPVMGGIVDAAANFVSAVKPTEIEQVVIMSMAPSSPVSPSHLGRAHWLAEDLFEKSGLNCIIVRVAGFFFENLPLFHTADISRDGVIRNSFGDASVNWISGADAGKLAVTAILHPVRFAGKHIVYPSGIDKFTHEQVAALLSKYLKKEIKYEAITQEAWQVILKSMITENSVINEDMALHISTLGASLKKPMELNGLFEELTGDKPISLEQALQTGSLKFNI
jgi:uncharacterized protein YbjT (DUF2867 family)